MLFIVFVIEVYLLNCDCELKLVGEDNCWIIWFWLLPIKIWFPAIGVKFDLDGNWGKEFWFTVLVINIYFLFIESLTIWPDDWLINWPDFCINGWLIDCIFCWIKGWLIWLTDNPKFWLFCWI